MKTLTQLSENFFDLLKCNTNEISESDLLCFRNCVINFLNSGKKDDAFTVYYCFSEIFKLFGTGYDNTQKLLETLSDHEYHSGELLAKHRDHYSHSAYVFALGFAIYANDGKFRNEFNHFYSLNDEAPYSYLRLWGITALFHDIGYPFQLAHEQIKNYLEELWVHDKALSKEEINALKARLPYASFGNMDSFLKIEDDIGKQIEKQLQNGSSFSSLNYRLGTEELTERVASVSRLHGTLNLTSQIII